MSAGDRRVVRDATAADAAACRQIYAPYVRDTVISFEAEPPSEDEMARRIAAAGTSHAWLVLEEGGEVTGYAYGGPFATRAAYRWSCEVSIYMAMEQRRAGGGRALYGALLTRLGERGYQMAAAGMTLPNDASAGFHRAMGFEPVGTWRRIGFKDGAWRDVALMQRQLADGLPAGDPS